LKRSIHAIPAFQETGASCSTAQEASNGGGFTAAGFEGEIRRELTRAKWNPRSGRRQGMSEAELEQQFRLRREEVRAAWALVELRRSSPPPAPREELAAYIAQHPDEFRQPDDGACST